MTRSTCPLRWPRPVPRPAGPQRPRPPSRAACLRSRRAGETPGPLLSYLLETSHSWGTCRVAGAQVWGRTVCAAGVHKAALASDSLPRPPGTPWAPAEIPGSRLVPSVCLACLSRQGTEQGPAERSHLSLASRPTAWTGCSHAHPVLGHHSDHCVGKDSLSQYGDKNKPHGFYEDLLGLLLMSRIVLDTT